MSSDEAMLLSLILRKLAEGSPEYGPDEVREEIVIPVDGVGAYATDEADTSIESTTSEASDPGEPPAADSQVTPEQVVEDDRIDLSVAAIQAFTDGELTLSDEQEVDVQSVVRELSGAGHREIRTTEDVRDAIAFTPNQPDADETEPPQDEADDEDEDWAGMAEAEAGSDSSSVEVEDEKDSILMGNFGADSEDETGT